MFLPPRPCRPPRTILVYKTSLALLPPRTTRRPNARSASRPRSRGSSGSFGPEAAGTSFTSPASTSGWSGWGTPP
eukprot:2091767-Alexandrium_andersonii.AAC.1